MYLGNFREKIPKGRPKLKDQIRKYQG